jgi:hypothetical protein
MSIRTTPKMIVKSYFDYRQRINDRGDENSGPADVYYSRADFDKAAKHYGWGNVAPTDKVQHMGDTVTAFEVLHGALQPVRVRYL